MNPAGSGVSRGKTADFNHTSVPFAYSASFLKEHLTNNGYP